MQWWGRGEAGVCVGSRECAFGEETTAADSAGRSGHPLGSHQACGGHTAAFYRSLSAPLMEASVYQEGVYGSVKSKARVRIPECGGCQGILAELSST